MWICIGLNIVLVQMFSPFLLIKGQIVADSLKMPNIQGLTRTVPVIIDALSKLAKQDDNVSELLLSASM